MQIIGKYYQNIMNQTLEFFKGIGIFSYWPTFKIEKMIKASNITKFQRNHIIYNEGDLTDKLFVILEGEVEVLINSN